MLMCANPNSCSGQTAPTVEKAWRHEWDPAAVKHNRRNTLQRQLGRQVSVVCSISHRSIDADGCHICIWTVTPNVPHQRPRATVVKCKHSAAAGSAAWGG